MIWVDLFQFYNYAFYFQCSTLIAWQETHFVESSLIPVICSSSRCPIYVLLLYNCCLSFRFTGVVLFIAIILVFVFTIPWCCSVYSYFSQCSYLVYVSRIIIFDFVYLVY